MPPPSYTFGKAGALELLKTISGYNESRTNSDGGRIREPNDKYFDKVLKTIADDSAGYEERTEAVVEMSELVKEVPRELLPDIWFNACPLTSIEVPCDSRRAVLKLLRGCVKQVEDDFIRSIFFQIIVDYLVAPSGARHEKFTDFTDLDPELDLILSSLNELLQENDESLNWEEKKLLSEVVSNVIELELLKDSECHCISAVIELLDLAQKLTFPLDTLDVSKCIEILRSASNSIDPTNSSKLQMISLKFLMKYLGQVHEDELDCLAQTIFQIFSPMPLNEEGNAMLPLLHCIVASKYRFLLGVKLFALSRDKKVDRMGIAQCYGNIYVQAVDEGKIDYNEAFSLLGRLFDLKIDDQFLRLLDLLFDVHHFLEDWVATEGSTQTVLWSMIQEVLIRFKGSSPPIIDKLLVSVSTYPSLILIVPESLVHFVWKFNISIKLENLIHLFELRKWDFKNIRTLTELTDLIIIKDIDPSYRVKFLKVYKLWFQEINDKDGFQWNISLMNCVWNIYSKVEGWVLSESELIGFGELLYTLLQLTTVDLFNGFMNTKLLPTIRKMLLQKSRRKSFVGSLGSLGRSKAFRKARSRFLPILIKTMVKLFVWSPWDSSASKCVALFDALISIYEYARQCQDSWALLAIARSMVRIRSDSRSNFYFTDPEDTMGISSAFGRLKNQIPVGMNVQWTFPETVDFIYGDLLGKRNEHVQFESNENSILNGKINMGVWLSLAIDTIEDPVDWEIYSYLLTHLCSQLSELKLFEGHYKEINRFKNVICRHLIQSLPSNITLKDRPNRSSLNSAYGRNLSVLLAYSRYESKDFADDLVEALVFCLRSWEKTLIPVLHILTVGCFEIPGSIKRYITPILLELQKRITTLHAIPSILEFLLALKSSPPLVSSLTSDETKRVFATVFNLIENSIFLKERSKSFPVKPSNLSTSGSKSPLLFASKDYDVEISSSTESFLVGESMTKFFQYQSFMVLASWLSNLKPEKIDVLLPFVLRVLDKFTKIKDLKYDALAYRDFVLLLRFSSYNNTPLVHNGDLNNSPDAPTHLNRWIGKNCLVTIRTSETKNEAIVELRRPSCECSFEIKPQVQSPCAKYKLFEFEEDEEQPNNCDTNYTNITPEQIIPFLCIQDMDSLISLPRDDPTFNRPIGLLDRIPRVEFQKTGIIYVGPDQNEESQVLSNDHGSLQYNWFLTQIGEFIKLKESGKFFHRGGLDPEVDGEYALIWSNATTQITFHTVTLMPPDKDLSFKKRHVGNNFVNIFYNESGLSPSAFNFNIIKSQFTFINIIIIPELAETIGKISQHYKVKIYRRAGVPGLLSCTHFKTLDRSNLARYVRHVSLIANALAEKYNETGSSDACSIWGVRCKQLSGIHERIMNSKRL